MPSMHVRTYTRFTCLKIETKKTRNLKYKGKFCHMLKQRAVLTYGGMEVKSDVYEYVKVVSYILQPVHFRKLESPVS